MRIRTIPSACLLTVLVTGCMDDPTGPTAPAPQFDHRTPPAPATVIDINNYRVVFHYNGLETSYGPLNALFNGGLAYGTGPGDVHVVNLSNGHFDITETGLPVDVELGGALADHHSITVLTEEPSQDLGPKAPLGLVTVRETFAWSAAPDDDFVIVKYSLTNTTDAPVSGLEVGYMADPDLGAPGTSDFNQNRALFDNATESARTWSSLNTTEHGIGLIGRSTSAYSGWQNGPASAVYPFRDPSTNAGWWSLMSTPDFADRGPADVRQYVGTGGITIPAGSTEVIAFVLSGGDHGSDLTQNLAAARLRGAAPGLLAPQPAIAASVIVVPGTVQWTARITFASSVQASAFDVTRARCGGAPIVGHAVAGSAVDVAFDALAIDSRRLSGEPIHCAGRLTNGTFFTSTGYPVFDDGSIALTQLTGAFAGPSGANRSGSWSPDGAQIAFGSARLGGGIFLMAAAGDAGGVTRLTQSNSDNEPTWHPGGGSLAFARQAGCVGVPSPCIMTVDIATLATAVLTGSANDPRYSPDGSQIAFRRGSSLWLMNADGSGAQALVAAPGSNLYPVWTADGGLIYFTRIEAGVEDVYRIDPAVGGAAEQVTPVEVGTARYPAISPDGKSLIFLDIPQLIHQDLESGLHTVLKFSPPMGAPNLPQFQNVEYSPDGTKVLFLGGDNHLYSFAAPGQATAAERIADISAAVETLAQGGLLSSTDADQMAGMLDTVATMVSAGKLNPAINHVGAFINKVNALVRSRRLGQIPGTQLTSEATSLITQLRSHEG